MAAPGISSIADVGYKVAPSNEDDVVAKMERILNGLDADRDLLNRLREQGLVYARECLTWDAKAQATTQVLNWAVGKSPKPDLPWSRMARVRCLSEAKNFSPAPPFAACDASDYLPVKRTKFYQLGGQHKFFRDFQEERSPKKVMVVIGTRPEAIKLAPVVLELERHRAHFETRICVTGQHREMLDQMLRVFGLRRDHDWG